MTIRFIEKSYAYKLISVLAAVGECSYNSLNLMGYGNAFRRKVMSMTEMCVYHNPYNDEKVKCIAISISGEGKMKKIRLRRDAYPLLIWMDELSDQVMDRTEGKMHGDIEHISRNFRIAESSIMMQRADIEILQSKMMKLSKYNIEMKTPDYPCFHNSISIKRSLSDEQKKGLYTRYTGLMIYPGQAYAVYNIQNDQLNWNGHGELKAKILLERMSANAGGSKVLNGAVIFGKSYKNALKSLIEIETSIAKKRNKFIKTDYRLDKIYECLYFIELNELGMRFLKTMTVPGWKAILKSMFFSDEMLRDGARHLGYDAMEEGKYICMFFDHDIAKLEKFKHSDAMEKQKENCQVYCYREQVDFIRAYLGDDITIKTASFDEVYNYYFNENGGNNENTKI